MKSFNDLTQPEILALAISSEEEDGRIYADFAEGLREHHPDTAHVFSDMAAEENDHRRMLIDLYVSKFGSHIPLIRRQDVRGFVQRKRLWQVRLQGLWLLALPTNCRRIALGPMRLAVLATTFIIPLFISARAAFGADQVHDEIQVYNAEIASVGQWTYQQHLNYAAIGQTQPEVPGGFSSNHALQGTPEFAYGLTDWWEAGFYLPFAVNGDSQFLSDGAKIRSLFVVPDAAKRSFFYGVNFELGYELPRFSSVPWNLEIRPIIGVRNKEWEFIVNPIVDVGFGSNGEADFAPAVRLARNLGEDRFIGLEYYADFGKIGSFLPLQQQNQQLFAVTDFKISKIDVELGAGYGFTPGSDRFTLKAIFGYAFPAPNSSAQDNTSPSSLKMGTPSRPLPNAWTLNSAN